MTHKWANIADGRLYRFTTDRGEVFAHVKHSDPPTLWVYEFKALRSAHGKSDPEFRASEEAASARNRFGIALIRPMLRVVQADYPQVRTWKVDPVTRRHDTGPRLVKV